MSHFSVCVVIPAASVGEVSEGAIDQELYNILAPYWEATRETEYLEFEDKTEEATDEYESHTRRAIQYPDGRVLSSHNREFSEHFTIVGNKILELFDKEHGGNHETETSKQLTFIPYYPLSKLYSFEEYCEECCGYQKSDDGRWGYYYNPNAQWDWFEIGGRFYGELLVKEGTEDALYLPESEDKKTSHPEGFRYVNGAFMKDIAWEKMRELKLEAVKTSYEQLLEIFRTQDKSKLGPLSTITEEGIAGWGTMLYLKDETLEEYMIRRGVTDADLHPIQTFAFVNTEGEWFASGDMGWFGMSSNDKPERVWLDDIKVLTEEIAEDDFVVIVDCHI